jgi:hypothetical protein
MSHWLDYYRLLVINSFVLTILIIHKLVHGSGAVTPSPSQSFSGPSPAGLMTTFYCLRLETPPTWWARSP